MENNTTINQQGALSLETQGLQEWRFPLGSPEAGGSLPSSLNAHGWGPLCTMGQLSPSVNSLVFPVCFVIGKDLTTMTFPGGNWVSNEAGQVREQGPPLWMWPAESETRVKWSHVLRSGGNRFKALHSIQRCRRDALEGSLWGEGGALGEGLWLQTCSLVLSRGLSNEPSGFLSLQRTGVDCELHAAHTVQWGGIRR